MDEVKLAISMLNKMLVEDRLDPEEIEQMIDILEAAKGVFDMDNEEIIDKIDELEDCFEYLLVANKPLDLLEIKCEVADLIEILDK